MRKFVQLASVLLLLVGRLTAQEVGAKYSALREAFAKSEVLADDLREQVLHLLEQDAPSQVLELEHGAKVLSFSPSHLSLQTSQVGRWELRLLPLLGGNTLAAVIETVLAPQTDARLSLYDRAWRPLESPTPLLDLPQASDFLSALASPSSWASGRLQELLSPLHYEMRWGTGAEATLELRASLLLSEEDRRSEELMALVSSLPTLTYRWTGSAFVLQSSAK